MILLAPVLDASVQVNKGEYEENRGQSEQGKFGQGGQRDEKREKKYMSSSGGGIVEITEKPAKTGIAYWMELIE